MRKKQNSFEFAPSSYSFERRILMKCCRVIGTARALAVYLIAKEECWDEYLALNALDPSSPTFADDYLVSSMMSKHPQLPNVSHNKSHVAKEKWYAAEESCRAQNERWRSFLASPTSDCALNDVHLRVASVIKALLGPLTKDDLLHVQRKTRFGPGATSAVFGRYVVPSRKITSRWDVTLGLLPFYHSVIPFKEGYRSPSGRILNGNKVTFVPKNSKTDRAIAIEPHCNIYVQLGIGSLIRRRLLRVGIDLSNQKHKNRRSVLTCQKDSRVTIDLSSASDTISYLTVMNLLPFDWFHLLDIARSPVSSIDGQEVELQKFSSMGNGYTFELETLIFYAVCAACGDWGADVFGDDIICRSDVASDVITTLNTLGFSVNAEKTYLAGTFFESCGVDVHNGRNIRPFFLKGKYETDIHLAIRTANAVRGYAHLRNHYNGCDARFHNVWLDCVQHRHLASKTRASYPYDNGLWLNFDEATPSLDKRGWCGYVGSVFSGSPVVSRYGDLVGQYLTALAFGSSDTSRCTEYSRGKQKSFRLRPLTFFGEWYDLGGWF